MTNIASSEALPREGLAAIYEGFEAIATGGAGIVFKAWHRTLRRWEAVKILLPTLMAYTNMRERVVTEASAMAAIDHPNVVRVYTAGRITLTPTDREILLRGFTQLKTSVVIPEGNCETVYIAMEWIDGGTVEDLILSEQITQHRAGQIVDQLLFALEAVHAGGSIHRDVKAPNLLLTISGTVKLTDFGIVRSSSSGGLTRQGVVMGTPWYIPPEQVRDSASVDCRADLYAAGVLLHVLLVGMKNSGMRGSQPPEGNPDKVRSRVTLFCDVAKEAGDDPEFWQDVAPSVKAFILKATAVEPADRFQSAAEMHKALEKIKRDMQRVRSAFRTIVAPSEDAAEDPAPFFVTDEQASDSELFVPTPEPEAVTRPRRRFPMVLATTGALAVLALGAWALSGSQEPAEEVPATIRSAVVVEPEPEHENVPEPAIVVAPLVQEHIPEPPKVEVRPPSPSSEPPNKVKVETKVIQSKPKGFQITASGAKVWLGSYALPATVPAGSYELFAQFEGSEERLKVLDDPVMVTDGPATVVCNSDLQVCKWIP